MSTDQNKKTSNEFYSFEDFNNLDKIDMHLHINTKELFLIEQAKKDNFKLITINVDYPAFPPVEEQLDIAVNLSKAYPETLAFVSTFLMNDWDDIGWEKSVLKTIDSTLASGAVAVKVWKNIGMDFKDKSGKLIMIDDPKFDSIFSYIKKQNVPLMGHLGEPRDCWLPIDQIVVAYNRDYFIEHSEYHMYTHPELPSYEDQISARDNMLEKNKDIVFVGAHFASIEWSVDVLAKFLDRFPLAVVDTAARMGDTQYQTISDRDKVRNFFIKYQDRVMYATDTFQEPNMKQETFKQDVHEKWISDWRFLATDDLMSISDKQFKGLQLPKTVIDKIYKLNAKIIFPGAWKNQ